MNSELYQKPLSKDNVLAAFELWLHSMHLILPGERVMDYEPLPHGLNITIGKDLTN